MTANLAVEPEEGLEVIVTGRLTTFSGQSKYQIVVSQMEVAGEGALLKQLEDRRRMLAAEGLFDAGRKKKIPKMPKVIGVVTSPTGAVVQDILHRLNDRFGVHVMIWGTLVQGRDAAAQVAAAISGFDAIPHYGPLPRPDVLIVARGGGALEDLWTFNEEVVIRAVADCSIPVISAIGHETDTTLIDLVADLRAPTPTAAAELSVPVKIELAAYLGEIDARLLRACSQKLENKSQRLAIAARGFIDPGDMIQWCAQKLDYALGGLFRGLDQWLSVRMVQLSSLTGRLWPPETKIAEAQGCLSQLGQRLDQQLNTRLIQRQQNLDNLAKLLDANSFERVLNRGFALVMDVNGVPVKLAAAAPANAAVTIQFADAGRGAVLDAGAAGAKTLKKPQSSSPQKSLKQALDDGQEQLF